MKITVSTIYLCTAWRADSSCSCLPADPTQNGRPYDVWSHLILGNGRRDVGIKTDYPVGCCGLTGWVHIPRIVKFPVTFYSSLHVIFREKRVCLISGSVIKVSIIFFRSSCGMSWSNPIESIALSL